MDYLTKNWKWGMVEGIVLILCGWIALARPVLTSLSLTLVVGALLAAAGLFTGYRAIRDHGEPGFWPSLLSACLFLIIGVLMFFHPVAGMLTLVGLVTAFFAVDGVLKLVLAWNLWDDSKARWLFVVSGILSILLALIVWLGWPATATWFLGILFGINLIFSGTAALVLSWRARSLAA